MSNYLAIATVTATLQRILQQAIQTEVEGASVTTSRPDGGSGGVPETSVNLYLYHIKRNTAYGNTDTTNRQRRALMVKRNQIAIDLFYVITFSGDESELEPQKLLGTTLRTLEDNNILMPEMIRETISDPSYEFIADSDLADQVEMIRSEFLSISTDELSKIWSVFFQTPYTLSVVYKVSAILIEGETPAQMALPVKSRNFTVFPYKLEEQPLIQQVTALSGSKYEPIVRSSTLSVKGKKLGVQSTLVRIGDELVAPSWLRDNELRLPLSNVSTTILKAGVQGMQIVRPPLPNGRSSLERESNVFPFIIRPTITNVSVDDVEGVDDDPRSGRLTISLDLEVGRSQRLVLILNLYSNEQTQGYLFQSPNREDDTDTVSFSFQGVMAGEYLVRVQVDGAESIFNYGADNSPDSISPRIVIP